MVKLVDTQDLKSCAFNGRAGSIPAPGTIHLILLKILPNILPPEGTTFMAQI